MSNPNGRYRADPHNTILAVGAITYETLSTLIPGIIALDQKAPKSGFRIRLTSPGGETAPALAIYDTLMLCKSRVTIEAFGECSSAAAVILQAADRRWVSKSTSMLIHDSSAEMNPGEMSHRNLTEAGKELQRLNRTLYSIFASRTGRPIEDIQKWCENETRLSAIQIVEFGLADWVIEN
jgi:ATP-dependent protease ClpP protease subunit